MTDVRGTMISRTVRSRSSMARSEMVFPIDESAFPLLRMRRISSSDWAISASFIGGTPMILRNCFELAFSSQMNGRKTEVKA